MREATALLVARSNDAEPEELLDPLFDDLVAAHFSLCP
jgi:hypothetical protein